MIFRFLLLLFCVTAICAQKGRKASASESNPNVISPVRAWAGRKTVAQESDPIEQQVQQKGEDPDDPEDPAEQDPVPSLLPPPRPAPPPIPAPNLPPRVALPPPRPLRVIEEAHPAPEPYSYSWAVDDPESGAKTGRSETQDASGEVVGFYYLTDAEGRSRRVDYTAGRDGFRANIRSNEEGLEASAPADVILEVSPPVRPQPTAPIRVIRPPLLASPVPVQQRLQWAQSIPQIQYLPVVYRS